MQVVSNRLCRDEGLCFVPLPLPRVLETLEALRLAQKKVTGRELALLDSLSTAIWLSQPSSKEGVK